MAHQINLLAPTKINKCSYTVFIAKTFLVGGGGASAIVIERLN